MGRSSGRCNPIVNKLLQEQLLVAYNLSMAFNYLHGLRCVRQFVCQMTGLFHSFLGSHSFLLLNRFYIHNSNNRLVYCDIKPKNIGFDICGNVKLFNFGLCKSLDRKHKDHKGCGYKLPPKPAASPTWPPKSPWENPATRKPMSFPLQYYSGKHCLWIGPLMGIRPHHI